MRYWIALIFALLSFSAFAENDGRDVVVVFNSTSAESKDVAEHYAQMRDVPKDQVIGFNLPRTEAISRAQFREKLQEPLLQFLEKQKLLTFKKTNVVDAQIRYVVLCYGVPLKIESDPTISEKVDPAQTREQSNNGAAVDSELAALPLIRRKLPLAGPLLNPSYRGTNSAVFNPTNGVLMVARIDGPTVEIARALVDKAIQAERDGLWGRAFIDMRGITNGPFASAETNFMVAAECAERIGFDTVIDRRFEPFSKGFPMNHIALFAGWGDMNVTGPFTRPKVEFMPGAFAYALNSYNAATLRSTESHWAGPLLAKGATATMGAVDEPFLGGLPDMGIFFTRWLLLNLSYGEAAYGSFQTISWQGTVIGDPLYRPFRKTPQQRHEELVKRGSKLVEWSHLGVININIATRSSTLAELIGYLKAEPTTKTSAVLTEKLGDLYQAAGDMQASLEQDKEALKLNPSPQQEVRLRLLIINKSLALKKPDEALTELEQFRKHCPDYPEMDALEQQVRKATSALRK